MVLDGSGLGDILSELLKNSPATTDGATELSSPRVAELLPSGVTLEWHSGRSHISTDWLDYVATSS